jgi:uncharacterized paraquat-inducible protein A
VKQPLFFERKTKRHGPMSVDVFVVDCPECGARLRLTPVSGAHGFGLAECPGCGTAWCPPGDPFALLPERLREADAE